MSKKATDQKIDKQTNPDQPIELIEGELAGVTGGTGLGNSGTYNSGNFNPGAGNIGRRTSSDGGDGGRGGFRCGDGGDGGN